MAKTATEKDLAGFKDVTKKTHADQAKFFLNAFWAEYGKDAETLWKWVAKVVQLDEKNGKEGNDLDEFSSHRFLESIGETRRVVELRESLRSLEKDSVKRMALIEYLLSKYNQSIKELMSRPQGTNEDLIKAQQALADVQKEIKKIEDRKTQLEEQSKAGGVKGMQAKAQLDQLYAADQTDLNRTVLTAEAAVRKAQKAGDTNSQGSLFWAGRELEELKKYKPQRKQ
eukprot:TRINITY_DN13316_c0_g1_i1.p1 TRINITY_DN13316_c0_g1~~TRINITY_DN13316_c0_g1_i1.p1  ORF type:complete len:227 (+),score=143.45 TRINITY_DN13316_c0_g1_i1:28-708(+)